MVYVATKPQKQKPRNKAFFAGVAALSLGILTALSFAGYKVIENRRNNTALVSTDTPAQTTSTAESAQENFTGGSERSVAPNEKNEGTIQDTGGEITEPTDSTTWSASADGVITIYAPTSDSIIKSGDVISGETSLSSVSFRLIDDVSGVISQGMLTVTGGKFSGVFQFSTTGQNGRLDIFKSAVDGTESSNVEIPVRFK